MTRCPDTNDSGLDAPRAEAFTTPSNDAPDLSAATLPRLAVGAVRSRHDRPVRNGRWYLVGPAPDGLLAKVGWGDMSTGDLRAVATSLATGWTFLTVPENPSGGQHLPFSDPVGASNGSWCWYDRPDHDPLPGARDLAEEASYAVFDGELHYVDRLGLGNRAGNIWLSPGYRYTRAGTVRRTGKVRFRALTAADLEERLLAAVGPNRRAVTAFDCHAPHR